MRAVASQHAIPVTLVQIVRLLHVKSAAPATVTTAIPPNLVIIVKQISVQAVAMTKFVIAKSVTAIVAWNVTYWR